MKKLMILTILLIVAIATHAQEPQNYVIIEQPTNVRSGSQDYWYYTNHLVRGVVSDVQLPVIGRNFVGNQICTGIWELDRILWLQVDLYGIEGWVKFCENDFEGDISLVPMTTSSIQEYRKCFDASSNLDHLGADPATTNVIARTLHNTINLREAPDITSSRMDILKSNQVYVIGHTFDNVWFKVTYDGVVATCGWNYLGVDRVQLEGWVAGFLLDLPDGWQDIIPIVDG